MINLSWEKKYTKKSRIKDLFKRQKEVLVALLLRNIRTKFFGNGIGYVVAISWPLIHILILIVIFSVTGRIAPYGESVVIFIATGTIPFMTFSYLSRFMMLSVLSAKPLFGFPEVKVTDALFAGIILEILSAAIVIIILIAVALFCNIDFWPRDIVEAFGALSASVLLGIGFGIFNGILAMALPIWGTVYVLITILLWVTSGVVFVPDSLPRYLKIAASYHPTLLIVEWMRSAYFDGYGAQILDRFYLIKFAVLMIFVGLVLERSVRGYISSGR